MRKAGAAHFFNHRDAAHVEKIRAAIMPHLFAYHRPPAVLLASLGDLGGAIGATLLAAGKAPAHA